MNRVGTMARFEEPEEPKLKAQCVQCFDGLYEGEEVVKHEDEIFCDTYCFLGYYAIEPEIL